MAAALNTRNAVMLAFCIAVIAGLLGMHALTHAVAACHKSASEGHGVTTSSIGGGHHGGATTTQVASTQSSRAAVNPGSGPAVDGGSGCPSVAGHIAALCLVVLIGAMVFMAGALRGRRLRGFMVFRPTATDPPRVLAVPPRSLSLTQLCVLRL